MTDMPTDRFARALRPGVIALLALVLAAGSVVPGSALASEPPLGGPAPSPTRGGAAKGSGVAPEAEATGRLIVRYAEGVSEAERGRLRAANGLELASSVALPRTEVVTPVAGLVQAVAALGRRPEIAWVQPEQRLRTFAGPTSEPYFGQQWALHNTGQTVGGYAGVPDVDINVPEAWAITQGSPSVVVAVLDNGVDLSHPDLAGRAWTNPGEIAGNGIDDDGNDLIDDVNGWDFCADDNTLYEPGQTHGTHVAGSIAASGNGVGIAGVAPQVTVMAVRFLSDNDADGCGTDTQAADAIAYAVSMGARIVNASWGGYGVSTVLRDAIAAAPSTLFVAASGNDNVNTDVNPVSPASLDLPNILSVAAIHNEGHLTDFTNFGPSSVDIVAPGEDIISLAPGASPPYAYGSGTSMAAPHVTGVAALAASAKPALLGHATALRAHLIRTARAMPSTLGWVANARMVDARAAVVSRPDVVRLSGADRFATAAAISKATFVPGVPYLFVATGRGFPDALAGGALAAQLGAPLLLVSTSSIPTPTLNEIKRLKPTDIYVLGGPAVVAETVLQQLRSYDHPTAGATYRLSGSDRFATAAAISGAAFAPGVDTAFIATGANFPDALAGAPASAALGGPLLLVTATSTPAATRTELGRLKPKRIVILGGPAVVSSTVAGQLDAYTTGPVSRWSGPNRYATAATIAVQAFPSAGTVFVANGLGFPDALAGGPTAGAFLGPLVLTAPTSLPDPSRQQLLRLKPVRIFVLGGSSVVSETVVTQVKQLFP
jgi:subtilisin family serine protease/putative cell wall-binding protein